MPSLSSSPSLSTLTAFTTQLLNMSTTSIKQLKQYVIKTMEDNLLTFEIGHLYQEEKDLHQPKEKQTNESKIELLINTFTESYRQKQLQVDTLANFILQFLSSLQDVYQQMKFKDKRINGLKQTIDQQTDVIKGLEDDVQQYVDRLNNAEDYIHWMEEEYQYFDLLCISNPKYDLSPSPSLQSSSDSRHLSKCRSQKTFTSSSVASTTSLSSSQLYIQNNNNTNSTIQQKRKKKLDYDRIKFYIESLKQQKNYLIKEYNMLLDQHQKKLFECEKHSVLLGELFDKYKSDSMLDVMTRVVERKNLNGIRGEGVECVNCEGTNTINKNKPTKYNNISQFDDDPQEVSICLHHNNENPQILQSKIIKQKSQTRNTLKMQCDQYFIQGNNSIVNSFISDIYLRHNVKMDVGVNTKKGYFVTVACQTDCSQNQNVNDKKTIKQKQDSSSIINKTSSQNNHQQNNNNNINCQISINLKNLSTYQQIKKINFSKLITREVLGGHHHNKDNKDNNNNINSNGYTTTCHRQKNRNKKHLCQHIYCFLTNKVVTQRIKKYKYGTTASNNNRK